jgi:hypothetical protein
MPDFIPPNDGELVSWLTNLKNKLPTIGSAMGVSTGDVASGVTLANNQIALQLAVEGKKAELTSSVAAKNNGKASNLKALRNLITRIKTLPGYNTAIGAELGIVSTGDGFDPLTFKPILTLELHPGFVRVKFTKGRSEGVNIYSRLKGEATWTFLARDTHSPYDDHRAAIQTDKADFREYCAFALMDDHEIGVQSDIVSITFGGL